MARTARSKSAPATTPPDAATESGDVKPLAPLATGIVEYMQKAIEVVKQSKTLQERILTVAHTFRDYTQYATDDDEDYDHSEKTRLQIALRDARAEAERVLQNTFDAFGGLYDAMTSPPAEFKEVAVALIAVKNATESIFGNGISQVPDIKGVLSFLSPLDIATNQLNAMVSELARRLFQFILSTIPNNEYLNDGSSLADLYEIYDNDYTAVISAQYRLIDDIYGTDRQHWQHIVRALQAVLPPLTPQLGETKEQTAKKEDVRLRIAVYLLELAKSDVKSGLKSSHIDKAVTIINGTDTIKNKMLELEQIPIFAKLTDRTRASSRVVADLLGCTHPAVLDARKLLQSGDAEVTRAEKQGRGLSGTDIDGTSKKAASGREDFNEEEYEGSVDLAADKLSVVGKDTVRKGARSKKHDPDAKHDRKTDEWLKTHDG